MRAPLPLALVALLLVGLLATLPATAQPALGGRAPVDRDAPVYYQADTVEYDRERGVVTLTGHVEFWQGERMLLADKVTYNRNTGVAAAIGHVTLLESDGQTVFADYAELAQGMKDGVMAGMRALLADNGRLAANGARRTDARVNELSRAVYSTCDLCAADPSRAPLWQLRAREVIQDKDNKRIEYHDAVLDFFGVPVLYTPFLAHPDPTEKRASGLLVPALGYSKHLGAYASVPYYWVIDDSSDATITPLLATRNGPAVDLEYRRRFNSGRLTIDTSVANSRPSGAPAGVAGHVFAKGLFSIDDTWRWGFDINRASSLRYMRDFRVQNWQPVLASSVFLEGFGQGSYTRLDARSYQGLASTIIARRLPLIAPFYQYSYAGEPDRLGGRIGLDFDLLNIMRTEGSTTRRAHLSTQWDRPYVDGLGGVWNLMLRLDSAAYSANQFDQLPNFAALRTVNSSQAMPTLALNWRFPLLRDAGDWGTQIVEPIVQIMAAPRTASYLRNRTRIPNEDSFDFEFTEANLFALNRFPGVDRLEGGMRAAAALRGAWTFPSGARLEGLVGQSWRVQRDDTFPLGSGLRDTASDIVSRVTVAPTNWLDITSRQRFDHRSFQPRFIDALASVGNDRLRLTGGYIYTTSNPFLFYENAAALTAPTKPRNEGTFGISTRLTDHWRMSAFARRDLRTAKEISDGVRVAYEDECFIFDVSLARRQTSINGDNGATILLFQLTFKTVGQFGFNTL
jgi:LPS-assembly protein